MSAIALCRVSTPEQKLSNSLNRQEQSVIKSALELEVEVVKWWSGDVSSKVGRNMKRKDLLEMYDYCKKHKRIKYLIVDEVDRFMRSIREMFYWELMFEDIGVQVWYTNPELNEDNSRSRLLRSLDGFKAEGSNEERQQKSVNGHVSAIKEGRYTFPIKPGYMKGITPGVHIPHTTEFRPLQKALNELASGLYEPSEVLERLNNSQFTKNRFPWRMDKFRKFATDPYYAGKIVVNSQVKAENEFGLHEPMISGDEHEKILEAFLLKRVRTRSKSHYNPEFPMNKVGLHDCSENGYFTGSFQSNGHGGRYPKYRCRVCEKQIRRQSVHDSMTDFLDGIDYDGAQQSEFIDALESVWRERQRDKLQQAKALQSRLEQLRATKSNLLRHLASAEPSLKRDFEEEIKAIKEQAEELQSEINKTQKLEDDLVDFVKFALEYTNVLKEDWWELDHEQRERCQLLIFPAGIRFDSDGKVSTTEISPLYRLATTKKNLDFSRDSLLVELELKNWHPVFIEIERWRNILTTVFKQSTHSPVSE